MHYAATDFAHKALKLMLHKSFTNKYNITEISNDLNQETRPFLLLGHHVTADDALITLFYNHHYIHYIYGDANNDNFFKKWMLKLGNAIPLSKNTSDIKAILQIKRHLKNNRNIGLFPEGGRNWHGATDPIIPSTVKLIKLLKVPVYISYYHGGYLSIPRWSNTVRKGTIELTTRKLFEPTDYKDLSIDDLTKKVNDALYVNAYDWQRIHMIQYKSNTMAEHIERLLYLCPHCNTYDSFRSKGNKFTCQSCHKTYTINQYGFIEGCSQFDNTVDWYNWQIQQLRHSDLSTIRYINNHIMVRKKAKRLDTTQPDLYKNTTLKNAKMTITFETITFESSNYSEQIPISNLRGLSLTFENLWDFYYNDIRYRIRLHPKKHISIKLLYDTLLLIKNGEKNDF